MLFLGFAACGEKAKVPQENDKPVVKIGASLPLSGDSGHIGMANRKTMEMVLERFKRNNLKYNYTLIPEDNQASPKLTATTANKLISKWLSEKQQ